MMIPPCSSPQNFNYQGTTVLDTVFTVAFIYLWVQQVGLRALEGCVLELSSVLEHDSSSLARSEHIGYLCEVGHRKAWQGTRPYLLFYSAFYEWLNKLHIW